MVKIAELYDYNVIIEYYYDKKNYYEKDENGNMIKTSILNLANLVDSAWSDDLIETYTKKIDDKFISTIYIPIYDGVWLHLYSEDTIKEKSEQKVKELYNYFYEYNKVYEKNLERNKKIFMSKIHKFAYFNDEIHYFKDSEKDFRQLVVECGVPNDARADEPIFGYLDKNNLVFFKKFFIKGERDKFEEFVNKNMIKIANYYNLDEVYVYLGVKNHYDIYLNENGYLSDDLLTINFDYYKPQKLKEHLYIKITLEKGTCERCGKEVLSIQNGCSCGAPVGKNCFKNSKKEQYILTEEGYINE